MEGSAMQPKDRHPQSGLPTNAQYRDPALFRISDADRNKVAEVLRQAAGDGRIDLDELDERLDATFAAKTYADLVPITVDLPIQSGASEPWRQPTVDLNQSSPAHRIGTRATATYDTSRVVMGECKRQGAWLVPEDHTAFALMGSVLLDLREATFAGSVITITAKAIMGEVKVLVDAHTHVVVDGTPIMGDFNQAKDKTPARLSANSPTVRVKGMAFMGSVTVVRQPPPGTPRKFLGTY